MGLDTSHDCWHGSYSGFSRWRNEVARLAGYEIVLDQRGGDVYAVVNDERWGPKNFAGAWDEDPEDPLLVLLIHSDCDGVIAWRHQIPLAARLEGLIPLAEAKVYKTESWGAYTAEYLLRFANGLRDANDASEDVEFG